MAKKKKKKQIRMFDVAFKREILEEVIQYYVDLIEPDKLTQEEATKTMDYAIQMVLGRIIHEGTPRVIDAMKYKDVKGYRITIDVVTDEKAKILDIPFNIDKKPRDILQSIEQASI